MLETQTTHRSLPNWLLFFLQAIVSVWRNESIRFPTLVFLALRVVTGMAALIMVHNIPAPPPVWLAWNPSGQTFAQALPDNAPLANLVEPWHRYDTAWYVKIAIQGYHPDDPSIVFAPLYPVLIHFLAPFCAGNYVLASLLISNAACLIAFMLLFKLVELEFGNVALARRTLIILALFPTSYYLVAGYTETLFLALTLGAFLGALRRRWLLAGGLALLASLARLQGAILLLPLGWIAYVQLRESGFRALLARAPVLVGPPLGAAAYMAYVAINNLGAFDAAFADEWQLYTRWPWEVIRAYWQRRISGPLPDFENDNALALLVLIVLGLIVTFKFRPSYIFYVWTTLALILTRYHEGPQFESIFRYALLFFPCFIAAGMVLANWYTILLYGAFTTYWQLILLDRFTHWTWVA